MAYFVRKSGVEDTSCEINRSLGDEYDSEEVFDLVSDSLVLTSSDESYFLASKMGGRLLHGIDLRNICKWRYEHTDR